MEDARGRFRLDQIVDWRAVVVAGILAAGIFLVLNIVLETAFLGSPGLTWRILASLILGPDVIPPGGENIVQVILTALLVHIPLSILFAGLIATVVHEWGMPASILAGALLGLALYLINFYGLALLFAWIRPMASWMMLVSHVAFGALVGGVYEALERDLYRVEMVHVK